MRLTARKTESTQSKDTVPDDACRDRYVSIAIVTVAEADRTLPLVDDSVAPTVSVALVAAGSYPRRDIAVVRYDAGAAVTKNNDAR